jgi:hypothetical protein
MKLLIALLFTCFVCAQDFTIVQINAEWNERNKIELPFRVEGANVIYGYLKDQPKSLQKSVRVVPVVVLYKDNKPVRQWVADISFKIKLSKEELIEQIKKEINKQKS